ncbi:metalloregulator ArsR/SmtB family transcription factor [Plantactinospora sp. B5E13]|uniref:ArsR/SmtB family transcription factor n=1 Tax=unclassified Plantactinospora TaxID=2631981 RepID=UPI00325F8388
MPAADQATPPHTCLPDPIRPPLARADAEQIARLLKALSDPTRLQILSIIEATGEACVCDLTAPFDMTQPAISHHLKILVDAGVLQRDKRGSWAWYSLNPSQLEPVRHLLPGPQFLQPAAV